MADKIFLADKETLDTVNRNVSDVHGRVGTTTDTGGSTTAGTIMGKLNALISSIASNAASWTAARAAKVDNLDAAVSTRQSEANALARYNSISTNTGPNNTASATGTLSQKLSHIINLVSSNGQKTLASKTVNFVVAAAGTHTILNISGSGMFDFSYTNMGSNTSPVTIEIDGQAQVFNVEVGTKYIFGSIYGAGSRLYSVTSNGVSATHFAASKPVYFKRSLKITMTTELATEMFFRGNYSIYE